MSEYDGMSARDAQLRVDRLRARRNELDVAIADGEKYIRDVVANETRIKAECDCCEGAGRVHDSDGHSRNCCACDGGWNYATLWVQP